MNRFVKSALVLPVFALALGATGCSLFDKGDDCGCGTAPKTTSYPSSTLAPGQGMGAGGIPTATGSYGSTTTGGAGMSQPAGGGMMSGGTPMGR